MKKFLFFILVFIFTLSSLTFAKTKDDKKKGWYENKFQMGFGATVTTGNLLGLIETIKMVEAETKNTDYNYPGMTPEQIKTYNELSTNLKRAIWVSNILSSLQYSIELRILWSLLMFHADMTWLPVDASYNGRFDYMISLNCGIRAPFFIMPYFTMGPVFTFSFYPAKVSEITTESWKTKAGWGVVDNFVFRPGLNMNLGVDIKIFKFSVGAFYQYTIKDFDEFKYWYEELSKVRGDEAFGMIFGAQSRFGVAFTFYFI